MIEWKKWSEVKPERNVMILAYNKKWKNLGNHGDDGIRYGFYDCKNDFVWANCDGEDEDFDSLRKNYLTSLPNFPYTEYLDCFEPTHWTYLPTFPGE